MFIKRILEEVWRNTSITWYNVVVNLRKGGLFILILIPGMLYGWLYSMHENCVEELENKVQVVLEQGWQETDKGDLYLNKYVEVEFVPYIFEEKHAFEVVKKRLSFNNYKVRAKKNNRAVGLYEKPEPKFNYRVEVVYSENVEYEGKAGPKFWFMSENVKLKNQDLKEQLKTKGYKLPLKN